MVLDPALLFVGMGRDVQHVLDPVASVRHLQLFPIHVRILESAMPIHAKAEQPAVKPVFDLMILDDEAGMEQSRTDLFILGSEEPHTGILYKRNWMPLGVLQTQIS